MTFGARHSLRVLSALAMAGFFVLSGSPADACRQAVPADEMTLASDAIVVGRLGDIRAVDGFLLMRAPRERAHYEGTIEIERTLWLDGQAPGSLTLHWDKLRSPVRRADGTVMVTWSSGDIDYSKRAGERILWFLSEGGRVPAGTYEAGSPNHTIRLENETSVRAARLDFITHRPVSSWETRVITLDERQLRVRNFLDETLTALEAARRPNR